MPKGEEAARPLRSARPSKTKIPGANAREVVVKD